MSNWRRYVYFSILLVSLGVVFTNTLDNALGIVFIAIGGALFIRGMALKKREDT